MSHNCPLPWLVSRQYGHFGIGQSIPYRLKTLVFYRDRVVRVAWDGVALCAVTIEPFEVSLRRGGCGGAMGFQSAGAGSWSCCAVPEGVRCPTSMRLVLGAECFDVVRRRLAGVRSS